jgi:hypothetical protein
MTTDPQLRTQTPQYIQGTEFHTPRRVWELPLAILLWTWTILGVLFTLLVLVARLGAATQ